MPNPPEGMLWVEFDLQERVLRGFGGSADLTGHYQKNAPSRITITPGQPATPPQRFARYYNQTLENLSLVKGYYIQGETYYESTLTLYGGLGREEIILAEFFVDPESPLVLPPEKTTPEEPPR
ncbi:hypothetical protein SAMN05920897_11939 [Alkalispirochaeta americana]|uniref:Uncharacterized protein n=2 Tax=Alkalispirochaeta americana TaxID=159291 RepID=A0A1N6WYK6_9SPIO|nr:hypothetical protein SAMN05920897_11939 [Alkalispirochaeta americana]